MTQVSWRADQPLGVLIAGKSYDTSGLTVQQVRQLCEEIEQRHEALGLVAVPYDADLTDETGPSDDEPCFCVMVVGVLAGVGGEAGPHEVSYAQLLGALNEARGLEEEVWASVEERFMASGGGDMEDEVAMRLGCVGPAPMAYLMYGHVVEVEDRPRSETLCYGQDASQRLHTLGVEGALIDASSDDGGGAELIDLSEQAHLAREANVPGGAYYLIGRCD